MLCPIGICGLFSTESSGNCAGQETSCPGRSKRVRSRWKRCSGNGGTSLFSTVSPWTSLPPPCGNSRQDSKVDEPMDVTPTPPRSSPYQGLTPFDERDAGYFFGRDRDT